MVKRIMVIFMVITPDIPNLPYVMRNGIKYFELFAEPVTRELLPGLFIKAWGYNGTTPGPTILVYPGDYVNIRVYNKLPEATSIWPIILLIRPVACLPQLSIKTETINNNKSNLKKGVLYFVW